MAKKKIITTENITVFIEEENKNFNIYSEYNDLLLFIRTSEDTKLSYEYLSKLFRKQRFSLGLLCEDLQENEFYRWALKFYKNKEYKEYSYKKLDYEDDIDYRCCLGNYTITVDSMNC